MYNPRLTLSLTLTLTLTLTLILAPTLTLTLTLALSKVRFFMEFMRGGFDVLCADLDVIWLKDPTPWLTGEADPTALLLNFPDVIVSTDVTHGGADSDEQLWGMGQEMNTGMLMLR